MFSTTKLSSLLSGFAILIFAAQASAQTVAEHRAGERIERAGEAKEARGVRQERKGDRQEMRGTCEEKVASTISVAARGWSVRARCSRLKVAPSLAG